MFMATRWLAGGAMVLAAVSAVGPVLADTDTDTLTVTATVQSGCALAGGSLDFGQYTAGQSADLDAAGSIDYSNCPVGTLSFELDGGGSGDVSARQMSSGGNTLNYQIFRDVNRSANWGSGGSAKDVQLFVAQSGSVDVYGRIPGSQTPPPGSYADTVTITLNF